MRNLLCMICMMFICIYAKAQVMDDDFESNQYNWAERSSSKGIALIRDGVMHLESKSKPVTATCYAPFDVNKPFVMTVEALAKKIDGSKLFGILLDYEDDQNFRQHMPYLLSLFLLFHMFLRRFSSGSGRGSRCPRAGPCCRCFHWPR